MRSLRQKAPLVLAVLSLFALLFTPGCKPKPVEIAPEIASSDEALFKAGQEYVKKDREKARLYFRQVIDSFPKSFYAQRAKLAIADSYFDAGDEGSMILAASEYREFIQLYPYSPSASYAQFRIAMTFFKKTYKPERDQTKTLQALAEFKRVIANYPLSEEAKEAQKKITECEERLARHVLSIAKHYYRIRAFKAAISRLTDILTDYPSFSGMDEVYFYLADSYCRGGKTEEGIPYFTKLITDYSQSPFARKARERLEEIERTAPKRKT